ncbi:MAG TPA: helix-turn-helix domain-containing protein [Kofleriaceae bacterium]|nr:helix-turn-helix domain-containing protein [Kofleriaceae bacterium]
MNHIVTQDSATPAPTYAERRAAMADETRIRILDACVAILARGVAELSIPAVAREAGVSVPTVYRNFPDKKTLVAETAEYLRSRRGTYSTPTKLEDLADVIRKNFEAAGSVNETVAAALQSEPILAMRRDSGMYQQRFAMMEALLHPEMEGASATDRENAVMMAAVLCSSNTFRAFRDITGVSARRAAEVVAWTISRLVGRDSLESTKPARKAKGKAR